MNVNEMVEEITRKLDNDDVENDDILSDINEIHSEVAATFWLPELITTETVTFSASDTSQELNAVFLHDAYYAYNTTTGAEVNLRDSTKSLYRYFTDNTETGAITDLVEEGGTLYCMPIPTTEQVITVRYYQTETDMALNGPGSTVIPAFLHRKIFVHGVLKMRQEDLEDGMDADKVNTKYHTNRYIEGLTALGTFYKWAPKFEPVPWHGDSFK